MLDSPLEIVRERNFTVKVKPRTDKPMIDVGSPLAKMATTQTSKHVKIQTFKDQNRQMLNEHANNWANDT